MNKVVVRHIREPLSGGNIRIDNFLPKSSSHRPRTVADLRHDGDRIHLHFNVEDRYVRAVSTKYHDRIWCDSCVEFFAQPRPDQGYFNFEFSANGQFLVSYIMDPTRVGRSFKSYVKIPWERARVVEIESSLSGVIDPELKEPVNWSLKAIIPVSLMTHYTGAIGPLSGQTWRGNFYKCGDETSRPHWAAWSPILSGDNFHQPRFFGTIEFV